jgi:hypothetical protein
MIKISSSKLTTLLNEKQNLLKNTFISPIGETFVTFISIKKGEIFVIYIDSASYEFRDPIFKVIINPINITDSKFYSKISNELELEYQNDFLDYIKRRNKAFSDISIEDIELLHKRKIYLKMDKYSNAEHAQDAISLIKRLNFSIADLKFDLFLIHRQYLIVSHSNGEVSCYYIESNKFQDTEFDLKISFHLENYIEDEMIIDTALEIYKELYDTIEFNNILLMKKINYSKSLLKVSNDAIKFKTEGCKKINELHSLLKDLNLKIRSEYEHLSTKNELDESSILEKMNIESNIKKYEELQVKILFDISDLRNKLNKKVFQTNILLYNIIIFEREMKDNIKKLIES